VAENQGNLKNVRWTNFDNLHITLLFLGDLEETRIPSIIYSLKSKVVKPFSLKPKGLTLAPPNRPPRMIWLEFEKNNDFDKLVENAFNAVEKFARIHPENNSIPHITLARFRDFVDFKKINLPQFSLEPLLISDFYLMESTLTPYGPIYQKLAEFNLE